MNTRLAIVISLVLVILAGISAWTVESPHISWVEIALMIPASLRPFTREGSRLAVLTEWSVKNVSINVQVGINKTYTGDISDVDKLVDVIAAVHPAPNLVNFLQDVKKWNLIFQACARGSYLIIGVSAIMSIVALMVGSTMEKILTTPQPSSSCNDLSSPFIEKSSSNQNDIQCNVPCSRCKCSQPNRTKYSKMRAVIIMILGLISGFCGTVSLIGSAIYALTIKSDIQIFLPTIIRNVQLLCITHGADACKIITHARYGLFWFAGANLALIMIPILAILIYGD